LVGGERTFNSFQEREKDYLTKGNSGIERREWKGRLSLEGGKEGDLGERKKKVKKRKT